MIDIVIDDLAEVALTLRPKSENYKKVAHAVRWLVRAVEHTTKNHHGLYQVYVDSLKQYERKRRKK